MKRPERARVWVTVQRHLRLVVRASLAAYLAHVEQLSIPKMRHERRCAVCDRRVVAVFKRHREDDVGEIFPVKLRLEKVPQVSDVLQNVEMRRERETVQRFAQGYSPVRLRGIYPIPYPIVGWNHTPSPS